MRLMRIRLIALVLFFAAVAAHANYNEFKEFPVDPSLTAALQHAADATLQAYPKLTADNLAMTIIDVTRPAVISRADYHGDAPFYPASVIKLFFMVEVFHQQKENDPDMPRALHEMITVSDNDATAFVVDTISGTCSGTELQGRALNRFIEKRRVVNEYLNPMGYDISAMAKPWSFGPFGRDQQLMGGSALPNRNRATTNAVASLLLWIERGRAVSPQASQAMLDLLERPLNPMRENENQVIEFIGQALPVTAREWSKAGWTSQERHDAAIIQFPDGRKIILVIFTHGDADDKTLIQNIAKNIFTELSPVVTGK